MPEIFTSWSVLPWRFATGALSLIEIRDDFIKSMKLRGYRFRIIATLSGYIISVVGADAYCSEPWISANPPVFFEVPPDPPGRYLKPDVPYCLFEFSYSGKHTCDEWELDSYFDDVNEYISELQSFANDATYYADRAREYAEEAIRFSSELEAFSFDALEYAKCEAIDVKSQHE